MTVKNLVEYSTKAVATLRTTHPYRLLLVDDHSTDGTKAWYQGLIAADPERVSAIVDPRVPSLGAKWNLAALNAWEHGSSAVVIANNDVLFHQRTIDAMVETWQALGVALVSAHNMRAEMKPHELEAFPAPSPGTVSPHPDFSCFLVPKSTWDTVGPFAECFIPAYWEDNDFSVRLGIAKLRAISTTGAPFYHYGSRTQNSVPQGLCSSAQFERNRELFRQKYKCEPGDALYRTLTEW
jgi:GT2 family glycosyltransferase